MFKPLGVWKSLGYPGEVILEKARPEDIRLCPVYGFATYRVPTYSDTSGGQQATDDKLALGKKAASSKVVRKRPRPDPSPAPDSSDCEEDSDFSEEAVSEDDEEPPLARKPSRRAVGVAAARPE